MSNDIQSMTSTKSIIRHGPVFFGITLMLVAPAMRRWMLATFAAFMAVLFTLGKHEPDLDLMGPGAGNQENGYYMTPLTWLSLGLLVFLLFLYPAARRRASMQVTGLERIVSAVRRPRQVAVETAATDTVSAAPPVYASPAPDPTQPDRPFYVPTYVGGRDSKHSEVASSGVVINERRTFDREAE